MLMGLDYAAVHALAIAEIVAVHDEVPRHRACPPRIKRSEPTIFHQTAENLLCIKILVGRSLGGGRVAVETALNTLKGGYIVSNCPKQKQPSPGGDHFVKGGTRRNTRPPRR